MFEYFVEYPSWWIDLSKKLQIPEMSAFLKGFLLRNYLCWVFVWVVWLGDDKPKCIISYPDGVKKCAKFLEPHMEHLGVYSHTPGYDKSVCACAVTCIPYRSMQVFCTNQSFHGNFQITQVESMINWTIQAFTNRFFLDAQIPLGLFSICHGCRAFHCFTVHSFKIETLVRKLRTNLKMISDESNFNEMWAYQASWIKDTIL